MVFQVTRSGDGHLIIVANERISAPLQKGAKDWIEGIAAKLAATIDPLTEEPLGALTDADKASLIALVEKTPEEKSKPSK